MTAVLQKNHGPKLMNARKWMMLLAASAPLLIAGCGKKEPERPAAVAERPGAAYVFAGRYQGVQSTNQFAVWVVDTYTGAVARCDTEKCGEWVVPATLASAPEDVKGGLREKAGKGLQTGSTYRDR